MKNWFTKNADINIEEERLDNMKKDEIPTEWIWVEGYKGTDKDMKCRGYQYEIGKRYIHDGETKECESGFHLCPKLNDVLGYYDFDFKNRYFLVKALVKKEDSINEKNKLVAKEIEFINEISDGECFKLCKSQEESLNLQYLGGGQLREVKTIEYKYIETFDDYLICKNTKDYNTFKRNKHIEKLIQTGIYTDVFAKWFVLIRKCDDEIFEKAIALASEDISHDMRMALLLT